MIKTKKTILAYLGIITIPFCLYQCCADTNLMLNGLADMEISYSGSVFDKDTIKGSFSIYVDFEDEVVFNDISSGFINSAYGSTCHFYYLNEIDPESIKLSCNRDFIINGIKIIPGSNILEQISEDYDSFLNHPADNDRMGISLEVFFDSFDLELEEGVHVFSLEMKTDNGIAYNLEADGYFKL